MMERKSKKKSHKKGSHDDTSSSDKVAPLLSIGADALLLVCECLTARDLGSFACVCRFVNSAASHDHLWRQLFLATPCAELLSHIQDRSSSISFTHNTQHTTHNTHNTQHTTHNTHNTQHTQHTTHTTHTHNTPARGERRQDGTDLLVLIHRERDVHLIDLALLR